MAIYHLSIKIITRGKGKSAVAAAAYRAADMIYSEYDGTVHDYTRKRGVVYKEIMLPENAPPEYKDRAVLWNSVEMSERYKTAQLAREIEVAIPVELTKLAGKSLVRRFVQEQFVNAGMCADICIHDDGGDNPHAHILLTMRPIEKDGSWGQKSKSVNGKKIPTVDWNDRTKAEQWRKAWADYCNKVLSLSGHKDITIDHRSYKRQGIEQIPTVHLGVAAMQMERRGIETERGNRNREIDELNKQLRMMKGRLKKLAEKVKVEYASPPTLWDVFSEIGNHPEYQSRTQTIADVKLMANTLLFIQHNDIETLSDMQTAVQKLSEKHNTLHLQAQAVLRRCSTLQEHVKNAETYFANRSIVKKWQSLKGEKADKYLNKYYDEITAYRWAEGYLTRHLNGRTEIPLKAWKQELSDKLARHNALRHKADELSTELRSAETIMRNAEKVMGVSTGERKRNYDVSL